MSIYHTLACALPKLHYPPEKNQWVPSREQMQQLLSPLNEYQQSLLLIFDDVLSGKMTTALWKKYEQDGTAYDADLSTLTFIHDIFSILDLARFLNLTACTSLPLDARQTQINDPEIRHHIQLHSTKTYLGLEHKHPWLINYCKLLESKRFALADQQIVSQIWQHCDRTLQQPASLTTILAMYCQWYFCHQRQPANIKATQADVQRQVDSYAVLNDALATSKQDRRPL